MSERGERVLSQGIRDGTATGGDGTRPTPYLVEKSRDLRTVKVQPPHWADSYKGPLTRGNVQTGSNSG